MKHIVCNGLTAALLLLTASSAAYAQTTEPKAFLNINGGAQTQQRTIDTAFEFPIYDQTGTVAASQNVGRGAIFDISGGYRIWNDVSIGVGLTTYSKTGEIAGRASIPHELFLDRHASSDLDGNSKRTERSVYIAAIWSLPLSKFMPMLDKFDLALSAGPSFITVEQDVLVGVTVPQGSQQATADIQRRKDSTVGVIVGADLTYMIMENLGALRNVGVGGFVRYQGGGGIELPPAPKQSTGGFQAGGGLRLRF